MRTSSLRLVGSAFSFATLFAWACTLESPGDAAGSDAGPTAEETAAPADGSGVRRGVRPPEPGEAFAGSATDLGALGRVVIEAFVAGDEELVEGYRLTEEEHNGVVFPELPAGQPEVNYPVDMAWQNISMRNDRSLGRQTAWFDGRQVAYRQTRCEGETEVFTTFVVHTDCWVYFEDASEGDLKVQLFKDVLERGGGFKVFRYYDEPPRRLVAS